MRLTILGIVYAKDMKKVELRFLCSGTLLHKLQEDNMFDLLQYSTYEIDSEFGVPVVTVVVDKVYEVELSLFADFITTRYFGSPVSV